jgi:hypothetical protein
MVMGVLSSGIKLLGHEVHHSIPRSVEVEREWRYTSTPNIRLQDVNRAHFNFGND